MRRHSFWLLVFLMCGSAACDGAGGSSEPADVQPADAAVSNVVDGACMPEEMPHELSCYDGLDNDCDNLTDMDDFDCSGPQY